MEEVLLQQENRLISKIIQYLIRENFWSDMKKEIRTIFYFFVSILFGIMVHPSVAAIDFIADYDTQYAISPSGTAIVTQNITLTNKQSNMYPKQFMIPIVGNQIRNVIAYDGKGVITPTISQHDGKTDITVVFNEKVIGIDSKLKFSIRYENSGVAQKLGNVWEVHIPGVAEDPATGEYVLSLQTPASFPPLAYIMPQPLPGVRWTKQQLLNNDITAAYGEYQNFTVDLTYNMENTTSEAGIYQITLPGDTAYQSVSITEISPKPKETTRDEDGNWIASYKLDANQKSDVHVKLVVKTYIKAKKIEPETTEKLQKYLQPQRFWETTDTKIINLAKQYKTPRDIYNFVVNTFTYRPITSDTPSTRKGALGALANPKDSVCTEFTDLFIAIARAAGIPAREIVGYGFTTDNKLKNLLINADVLHTWPEYYDTAKSKWIPVDPTWANTTGGINYFDILDFNHIAFVVHGVSSELPYPAGSYKEGAIPQKNVIVKLADTTKVVTKESFGISFNIPTTVLSGKTLSGSIQIENTGATTVDAVTVTTHGSPYPFSVVKNAQTIPPFGLISIPVSIPVTNIFARGTGTIEVLVNGNNATFTYTIKPMYPLFLFIGSLGLACIVSLWLLLRKK